VVKATGSWLITHDNFQVACQTLNIRRVLVTDRLNHTTESQQSEIFLTTTPV
jgi:hypothetical protein